jgi:hypothetical protein
VRRFLIFPLLWACLFLAGQITLELVDKIIFWFPTYFRPQATDVYIHILPKLGFFEFVPGTIAGASVGLMFATLDLRLNRQRDAQGNETLKRLLKHLFQSLVVAVLFIVVSTSVREFIWISYATQRRYHAYPPNLQLLNALSLVPFVVLAGAFLWSMSKSLRHRL